uniref:Uncharacterized protein n=1 Tax=Glossina pallidipes TaxID=7398 RepID=A0A1A9ZM77_GLOPL
MPRTTAPGRTHAVAMFRPIVAEPAPNQRPERGHQTSKLLSDLPRSIQQAAVSLQGNMEEEFRRRPRRLEEVFFERKRREQQQQAQRSGSKDDNKLEQLQRAHPTLLLRDEPQRHVPIAAARNAGTVAQHLPSYGQANQFSLSMEIKSEDGSGNIAVYQKIHMSIIKFQMGTFQPAATSQSGIVILPLQNGRLDNVINIVIKVGPVLNINRSPNDIIVIVPRP